jgi:DNA-directed RNA polymerase subunit RPC12/RpoP
LPVVRDLDTLILHCGAGTMSSEAPATFSCTDCGKKYTAKPALLGKKVRCTCGAVISVPEAQSESPQEDDGLYDFANDPAPLPKRTAPTPAIIAAPALPISIPGLKDDEYLCPDCSKSMDPGAIICAHCGFNLKTGAKMNVGRAKAPAKKVGSAFGVVPTRKTPTIVEDKKAQLLKMLVPASLIVVVVLAIVGYKMIVKASGAGAAATPVNKDDAEVARLTEDYGAKEIHAWFKENPQRLAGEYSPSQAIAKADQWQAMGAKQVLAFGALMTRSLAIELPDDPQQRKALFDFENKFALQHHYPPAKDEGQKYLLLNLGL